MHHTVVRRVLAQAGLPRLGGPARPSKIDAYLPFIRQTLDTFPTLTAVVFTEWCANAAIPAAPITYAI